MQTKKQIEARLFTAAVHDVTENPSILGTKGSRTNFENMIGREVVAAIQNKRGATRFPHLRGTVKDIISEAKNSLWMTTGHYLGGPNINIPFAATAPEVKVEEAVKEAAGPGTLEIINSLVGTIGAIGTSIWAAQQQAELAEDRVEAINQQTAALQTAAAQQQQAANMQAATGRGGFDPSSLVLPAAIVGGLGIAAYIFLR